MLDKSLFEVMLSSTHDDLVHHRAHVREVLNRNRLHPIAMENDATLSEQRMIDASLKKVDAADAYFCVVGKRYGQILKSTDNPKELSLTELEFNRAVKRGIPISVLIMGADYPVSDQANEFDDAKRRKLQAFRDRVKDSHRVMATFDSWEAFLKLVPTAVMDLRAALDKRAKGVALPAAANDAPPTSLEEVPPPAPPAFYVVKPFEQKHDFVGRQKELALITQWANGPKAMLVFEAIGGMGKSMVTYRWADRFAPTVHTDWAGRLWYSFYEEGASMNDFCVHALAYIEERPPRDYLGRRTADLEPLLLRRLQERPWLIVMDGLERVLVAYHRYDRAQLRDDEVDRAGRDLNRCVHPSDDRLLKSLATARPSKLLISSRNMPTVFINPSRSAIGDIEHMELTGLDPEDAEKMMRMAGVIGGSRRMRDYLKVHFGCHLLMVGIVAGLVNSYLPAPGNFDRWLDDPQGPSAVNLAELDDLIAKQNHILKVAFESLGPEERQLLGIFAFFSQAITGDVLLDLNPQRLPRPKEVKRPKPVDEEGDIALWMLQQRLRDAAAPKVKSTIKRELLRRRAELNEQFARQSEAYRQYEIALTQWRTSPELRDADGWLRTAVADLQKRGLLMRDRATARYDLHPMVRGFVRHALKSSESANIGRTVADYARSRSVPQYERASSLADLAQGIQIVIALTLGRHYEDAAEALEGNLSMALVRLELFTEWQALLQPLFSQGWDNLPDRVAEGERGSFAGNAAICFERLGDYKRAEVLYQLAIARWIADDSLYGTAVWIRNYAGFVESMGSLARSARLLDLHGPAAEASGSELQIGWHKVHLASKNLKCGALAAARQTLDELAAEVAARKYDSSLEAEILRFETLLLEKEGGLLEATVDRALEEARLRAERYDERILHYRRGKLLQSLGDHGRAIDAFEKSIAMAREVYAQAGNVEAKCAVSLAALRRRDEALDIARRIDVGDDLPHVELAELYLALDDKTKAYQHALAGYRRAWADGPPFAFHWDLEDCRKVLKALGECEPQCPPFDPARVQTFDFEPDLHRLLEKKAERVKEKRRKSGRKQRSLGRAS